MQRKSLNGSSLLNPIHQNSGNPVEKEVEGLQEPEEMEDTMRTENKLRKAKKSAYDVTKTETGSRGPAWVCTRSSVYRL